MRTKVPGQLTKKASQMSVNSFTFDRPKETNGSISADIISNKIGGNTNNHYNQQPDTKSKNYQLNTEQSLNSKANYQIES